MAEPSGDRIDRDTLTEQDGSVGVPECVRCSPGSDHLLRGFPDVFVECPILDEASIGSMEQKIGPASEQDVHVSVISADLFDQIGQLRLNVNITDRA